MRAFVLLILMGCGGTIGTVDAPAPETDAGASSFIEAASEAPVLDYGGGPSNPPPLGGYGNHTPKQQ